MKACGSKSYDLAEARRRRPQGLFSVPENLIQPQWRVLDSFDLRGLLEDRVGGVGQTTGKLGDDRLFLPVWGNQCRVVLEFDGNRISKIERGPAFDSAEWSHISATLNAPLSNAPDKVGRNFAFCGPRVTGWWRGARSGVQVLPPPIGAPTIPQGMGDHPFVLEFPTHSDSAWGVMVKRRLHEHRKLTLLLNVLLTGGIIFEPRQLAHAWACTGMENGQFRSEWLQLSYFADIGQIVTGGISEAAGDPVETVSPDEYPRIALRHYLLNPPDSKPPGARQDGSKAVRRRRAVGVRFA
ncbi:MAG: hypothetical protein JWO04_1796 [Gammaproteobacteria bacterium]|jgi:hypothetical protein|nr:hypothetical protein [Gammaproteobacteria bacterium]